MKDELQQFLDLWEWEAQRTLELLAALPAGQYDFRPDPGGRSLGELAWHLAETEAYMTYAIEAGKIDFSTKLPGFERPSTIEGLAPGFKRVHEEAAARVRKLRVEDLDRSIQFLDGPMPIRMMLSGPLLRHLIHHRGQLGLMCRMAGGVSPGIYGPNREAMAALRAAQS